MAVEPKTGMDRAGMKKLLLLSKKEPVHVTAGLAKEAGLALLVMDKVKPGRTLEAALKKDFPDGKSTAFGKVLVDTDVDAQLAKFTLNKAAGGLARRLVKTLKGTGIKKVVINDEEGNLLDSYVSEEEEEGDHATPPAPAAQPAAPQPVAPKPDAAQMAQELSRLAGGIGKLAAGKPDLQKRLVLLAQQVQAGLKSGDLAAAGTALAALEHAMGETGDAPPAAAPAADPSIAKFTKAKQAWIATHQMMLGEFEKLRTVILKTYEADNVEAELNNSFSAAIKHVTDAIDLELVEKLDAAIAAKDPAQRVGAASVAHSVIESYQDFLATQPIVADLDDNPFLPLGLHAKLSTTLTALAGAVR